MKRTLSSDVPGGTGSGKIIARSTVVSRFMVSTRTWLPSVPPRPKMLVSDTFSTERKPPRPEVPEKQHIAVSPGSWTTAATRSRVWQFSLAHRCLLHGTLQTRMNHVARLGRGYCVNPYTRT